MGKLPSLLVNLRLGAIIHSMLQSCRVGLTVTLAASVVEVVVCIHIFLRVEGSRARSPVAMGKIKLESKFADVFEMREYERREKKACEYSMK